MKTLLLAVLIALSTSVSGCVVYPARSVVYTEPVQGTVVYEGVQYYYDPTPAYVAGEVVLGLYFVDRFGVRHYHYVPHNRWPGPEPRGFRWHH